MRKRKKDLDRDFEIQFFEGVLKRQPDFTEALFALGDLYTQKGLYQKGLEIDQKLAELCPEEPTVFYNLACSYSLLNDVELALENLKRAVDFGYDDFRHLQRDGDLENLRKDDRFQQYFSTLSNK